MKKMRSWFLLHLYSLLILVLFGLSGCGGGGGGTSVPIIPTAKELVSIATKPTDNWLSVGKTLQFTAIGTYKDGSTEDLSSSVSWSASPASLVTLSPNGLVTAVAAGQTKIIATLGGISGQSTLTIPATTLVSIKVTPPNPALAIKTTQQFTATGAYSDGTFKILSSGVIWKSSDPSIAGIDQNGLATAVAAGTTTITATFDSVTASTTLRVATLASLSITPSNPRIGAGTTQQFRATGTLSGNAGTQDLTTQVTWSSSPSSVAGIDTNGLAKPGPGAVGTTTITAAFDGVTDSTTLTVTDATLRSIAVTPNNPVMGVGSTQQFTATGTFSDNTTQDLTTQVTWSSSASPIAGIAQNGLATAVAVGTTTISATFAGLTGSQNLNVTLAVAAGTWEGTYTIFDSVDPNQIGTYTFRFVLTQSGSSVSGTSALRYDMPGQLRADGVFIEGTLTGGKFDFVYTYNAPNDSRVMVNTGTGTIINNSMTGTAIENFSIRYNCSYIFSLKKL